MDRERCNSCVHETSSIANSLQHTLCDHKCKVVRSDNKCTDYKQEQGRYCSDGVCSRSAFEIQEATTATTVTEFNRGLAAGTDISEGGPHPYCRSQLLQGLKVRVSGTSGAGAVSDSTCSSTVEVIKLQEDSKFGGGSGSITPFTSECSPPTSTRSLHHICPVDRLRVWAQRSNLHVEKIRLLVRLLDQQHLRSLPVRKKSRKWPVIAQAENYRHHFYRQAAYILGWKEQKKFDQEFLDIVRDVWQD